MSYSLQGHVIMNTQTTSLYQRVIDKTKTLAFQSQFVAQNIDKKKAAEVLAQSGGVSGEFCLIWGILLFAFTGSSTSGSTALGTKLETVSTIEHHSDFVHVCIVMFLSSWQQM